jgi:hypothetical protein
MADRCRCSSLILSDRGTASRTLWRPLDDPAWREVMTGHLRRVVRGMAAAFVRQGRFRPERDRPRALRPQPERVLADANAPFWLDAAARTGEGVARSGQVHLEQLRSLQKAKRSRPPVRARSEASPLENRSSVGAPSSGCITVLAVPATSERRRPSGCRRRGIQRSLGALERDGLCVHIFEANGITPSQLAGRCGCAGR